MKLVERAGMDRLLRCPTDSVVHRAVAAPDCSSGV